MMEGFPADRLCELREEVELFHFLDVDCVRAVAGYFRIVRAAAGEVLWQEGDPCDYVGFIVSGQIEVGKRTGYPERQVILGVYSAGTVVGELCFFDKQPRAVRAVALEDTVLGVLLHEQFEKLVTDHPDLGVRLLKSMLLRVSIRLRKSFDRLTGLF